MHVHLSYSDLFYNFKVIIKLNDFQIGPKYVKTVIHYYDFFKMLCCIQYLL